MKYKNNDNLIQKLSYQFSLDAIQLYKTLLQEKEFIISKQIVRSATSIGTNVEEALAASSRKDFINKMSIATKEARETHYWLKLMRDSNILPNKYEHLLQDIASIKKILIKIVKTSKKNKNP